MERRGGAVVIGAGIAGLLAARVLSDHYASVTIVERDHLPDGAAERPGVPQAGHVHGLLVSGWRAMASLFPGLDEDLRAGGAEVVDVTADVIRRTPAGRWARFPSGLTTFACSRALLESALRRRVAALDGVRLLDGHHVRGLLADDGTGRVTGVLASVRTGGDRAEVRLRADLVADAAGRSGRTLAWLRALGCPEPRTSSVDSHVTYASREFCRPTGEAGELGWKTALVLSRPPENGRSGALLPLEGGRWMVTLAAAGGERPPADGAAFLAFAASLEDPAIHDAIETAAPISPIRPHRGTRNRLHHYEELDRWPEGLVVLGDAACAFNPVYGQGMAAAARAALALDRRLRRPGPGMARRFQRDLARVNARFWLMATSEDFRHPRTSGAGRGPRVRLVHWYTDRLLRLAPGDRAVCLRLAAVANMVSPPTALLAPPILWALAVAGCRRAADRIIGRRR